MVTGTSYSENDFIDSSKRDDHRQERETRYKKKSEDVCDSVPKKMPFTYLDVLFLVGSILFYIADTCSDLFVSYFHYKNDDIWYFSLTLSFIVLPRVIITGFNLWWYVMDYKNPKIMTPPHWVWPLRIVLLILQLGPALRHIDSLINGLLSVKSKDKIKHVSYYQQMIYEDADAALLKLFGAFLEAAPQLILQFYILVVNEPKEEILTVPLQWVSVVFSLLTLSYAIAHNQRAQRYQQDDKKNITWCGTFVQFIWFLFLISSRMLVLGLFASRFPFYFGIVCALHWAVMFIWTYSMKTEFCEEKWGEVIYNMVLGAVYIFCFINPIDAPTRYRWLLYYVFIFLQQTVLIIVWYLYTGILWYKCAAVIASYLTFFISIVMMVTYYLILHPTGNITVCGHSRNSNNSLNRNTYQVEEIKLKENTKE